MEEATEKFLKEKQEDNMRSRTNFTLIEIRDVKIAIDVPEKTAE